jgi:hypothetical protein
VVLLSYHASTSPRKARSSSPSPTAYPTGKINGHASAATARPDIAALRVRAAGRVHGGLHAAAGGLAGSSHRGNMWAKRRKNTLIYTYIRFRRQIWPEISGLKHQKGPFLAGKCLQNQKQYYFFFF